MLQSVAVFSVIYFVGEEIAAGILYGDQQRLDYWKQKAWKNMYVVIPNDKSLFG